MRQLMVGTAHDLNNLLVVVAGCAELTLDDDTLSPRSRELVSQILDVAGRARSLSNQCLLAGRQPLPLASVDLAWLLESSRGVIGRLVGEAVHVQLEPSGGPAWVQAEVSQLEQILFNLVVNARDAMPGGGRLTLAATTADVQTSGAARQVVRLIVSDTGRGIDPGVRDRMFEPHVTTKPQGTSAGLGLSVVRTVVTHLNGEIDVISARGVGTTFVVDLPLASVPGQA